MTTGILNEDLKVQRVMTAQAAGTDDTLTSDTVDLAGFDGVMFIALFGTLAATQVTSLSAQDSDDDSAYDALSNSSVGPLADDDDDQCLVLDVYRPGSRYVQAVITRATANAVVDGVVALLYTARSRPTTHDASTVAASLACVEET